MALSSLTRGGCGTERSLGMGVELRSAGFGVSRC